MYLELILSLNQYLNRIKMVHDFCAVYNIRQLGFLVSVRLCNIHVFHIYRDNRREENLVLCIESPIFLFVLFLWQNQLSRCPVPYIVLIITPTTITPVAFAAARVHTFTNVHLLLNSAFSSGTVPMQPILTRKVRNSSGFLWHIYDNLIFFLNERLFVNGRLAPINI